MEEEKSEPIPTPVPTENPIQTEVETIPVEEIPQPIPQISEDPNPLPPTQPPAPEPEIESPGVTIERTPNTVTITEVMSPPTPPVSKATFDTKSLFGKLKEKLFFRTEKRLTKIIELARQKSAKGESIQNDDVEKLLHVSDRTASRYLKKLLERGQLKNIGNPKWPKYSAN